MSTHLTRTRRLGRAAAGLTAVAGLIEIVVGANSWTGDKSQPTTLGLLTVVLAAVMATAATVTGRERTSGSSLAIAAGLAVPALISLTTAGRLAVPGALLGVVAGGFALADARRRGSVRRSIAHAWPTVLVAVLAVIYLAFGAVAGPIGILGIAGAGAAVGALSIRHRSRRVAAAVLVVGVIPFAVVAWWSVVVPLTAVLLLVVELPRLLSSPRPVSAAAHASSGGPVVDRRIR
ncbi:MAG: hypothetical protein AAFZ07_26810 [Actinomycetota bacterium]